MAVTDINRLTHPPITFQAFVHITATDTPLSKASHTAEPKSQERGNAWILCGRWTCSSPAGPGESRPLPLPAAVSSVPLPFCPRADSCAAPSLHLSWVFTCSSNSPELSSFLWFIQTQTSKLVSTASSARPLLLPRAGCPVRRPHLRYSHWTGPRPLLCAPSHQMHAYLPAVSLSTVVVDVLVCLPTGHWFPWTGLCFSSIHLPQGAWTNIWHMKQRLIPTSLPCEIISCSTQVEYVFLNRLLLVLLLLFHQWDYMLPTDQIPCLFSVYAS